MKYAAKRKVAKREWLLGELEAITPWADLLSALAPYYPKGQGCARPPIGLERMLCVFTTIKAHLAEKGLMLREGTIVDARIEC